MVIGFSKLLGGFMAVLEKIASWVGALFSIIPKTLYLLITFAMQIVDIQINTPPCKLIVFMIL